MSSVLEKQRLVEAVRCTSYELQFWSVRFAQRYQRLKAGEFLALKPGGTALLINQLTSLHDHLLIVWGLFALILGGKGNDNDKRING